MTEPLWVLRSTVLAVHEWQVDEHGGAEGGGGAEQDHGQPDEILHDHDPSPGKGKRFEKDLGLRAVLRDDQSVAENEGEDAQEVDVHPEREELAAPLSLHDREQEDPPERQQGEQPDEHKGPPVLKQFLSNKL